MNCGLKIITSLLIIAHLERTLSFISCRCTLVHVWSPPPPADGSVVADAREAVMVILRPEVPLGGGGGGGGGTQLPPGREGEELRGDSPANVAL